MANRYNTPVVFAMEPNIMTLAARVTFGATGVPTVDAINSKGIANVWNQTIAFSGATSSGSSTITSVSSFAGLYTGQTISGSGIAGTPTIGTISASTGSVVLSGPVGAAGTTAFQSSGGRYVFQFGLNVGNRLDSYYKLLWTKAEFHETSASASGSFLVAALAPAAPNAFVVANNTKTRTIPATATSGSTDCSLAIQLGAGVGTGFVAGNPVAGETMHVLFVFGNSSAI